MLVKDAGKHSLPCESYYLPLFHLKDRFDLLSAGWHHPVQLPAMSTLASLMSMVSCIEQLLNQIIVQKA